MFGRVVVMFSKSSPSSFSKKTKKNATKEGRKIEEKSVYLCPILHVLNLDIQNLDHDAKCLAERRRKRRENKVSHCRPETTKELFSIF